MRRLAPEPACCAGGSPAAVYVGGGAVVADGHAAVPRPRPPVCDRLDQRQRLERRVRVQRHRPPRRQIPRTAAHRLRSRATATRRPRSPSATTSRSSRPPPRACWRAIGPLSGRAPGPRAAGRAAARESRRCVWRRARERDDREPDGDAADGEARLRMRRAAAGGLGLWMLTGIVAVQPHGPPAPALRGRLHPGGRRDARDRRRVGGLAAAGRAARWRGSLRCWRRW